MHIVLFLFSKTQKSFLFFLLGVIFKSEIKNRKDPERRRVFSTIVWRSIMTNNDNKERIIIIQHIVEKSICSCKKIQYIVLWTYGGTKYGIINNSFK